MTRQAKPINVKERSSCPPSEPRNSELCCPSSKVAANVLVPQSLRLGGILNIYQVTTKWRDILTGSANSQAVINVSDWLSRATLDVIGEG